MNNLKKMIALLAMILAPSVSIAGDASEKIFECTGEIGSGFLDKSGKKEPFREIIVVNDDVATIGSWRLPLSSQAGPDYVVYLLQAGEIGHELVLFKKTGRFRYSSRAGRKLRTAEGDCKRVAQSKVFD